MRLWHWKLIPLLPKSQLLGQWRELNSIYRKQDKHILINYIYTDGQHTDRDFLIYSIFEYLEICYWNLREKHLRGQKDFTDDIWMKIMALHEMEFFNKHIKGETK